MAIARALAGDPALVFADEPTGSLDGDTARLVISVLRSRVARRRGALLLATHDDELADLLPRRLELSDGRTRHTLQAI